MRGRVMRPLRGVWMFAHGFHPRERVTNSDHGQDIVFCNILGLFRRMPIAVVLLGMFAPSEAWKENVSE